MVKYMLHLPEVKPLQPNKTNQSKQPNTLRKPNKANLGTFKSTWDPAREQRNTYLLSWALNNINIKIWPLSPPDEKKGEHKEQQLSDFLRHVSALITYTAKGFL